MLNINKIENQEDRRYEEDFFLKNWNWFSIINLINNAKKGEMGEKNMYVTPRCDQKSKIRGFSERFGPKVKDK